MYDYNIIYNVLLYIIMYDYNWSVHEYIKIILHYYLLLLCITLPDIAARAIRLRWRRHLPWADTPA
eukprot:COSAG06_NODE_51241_length_313_cov_0.967290_1_plen_65_part_01